MKLLMISGDRSMLAGKQGAFWYTLEELSKHWERVDVLCPRVQVLPARQSPKGEVGSPESRDSSLGTRNFFQNVYFHPAPHGLWYQSQWIQKKGKELIAEYHHNVMTVHEYPPFYNGIGARKLSLQTAVPVVLEVHHIVGYPKPASATEYVGYLLSRMYLPKAIRNAAACRVVNQATANTLIKWAAPDAKIRVVPSFYLDRQMIESLGEKSAAQYDVVFCARLVANKGALEVLRAIARLPDVTLLVIGDGPMRRTLQQRAQSLGIERRVTFLGWLPTQKDVLKAIRSAKVLVMNSKSEGGPRVSLEAMACGMPVIATKVGVMPDVITDGHNGIFTTGTPEDLAAKLERLLQDEMTRDRIGKEATHILDRFERTKLIAEYAQFLQSAAS